MSNRHDFQKSSGAMEVLIKLAAISIACNLNTSGKQTGRGSRYAQKQIENLLVEEVGKRLNKITHKGTSSLQL